MKAFVVGKRISRATRWRRIAGTRKQNIAPYKYPRAIEFIASLPRTETGKLQRFRLKQMKEQP